MWQLLSGTYAVGPRSLHCGGFGVLCGCGALIGLAAAHSWSRPLLYLVRRSPHRPPPLTPRPPPRAPLSVGGVHVALTALTLALAPTLPQHACTSLVTAGGAAQLLRKISRLLSSDLAERLLSSGATVHGLLSLRAAPGAMLGQHHGTHSSHRLLLGLGGVTVLVCLLAVRPATYHPIARDIFTHRPRLLGHIYGHIWFQVLAALTSLRLLCLPASWQSGADESRGMLLPTQIDRQARR